MSCSVACAESHHADVSGHAPQLTGELCSELRDYQKHVLAEAAQHPKNAHIFEMPCGSGKTRVCTALVVQCIRLYVGHCDILVLCPNDVAALAMYSDIRVETTVSADQILLVHTNTASQGVPRARAVWVSTYPFMTSFSEAPGDPALAPGDAPAPALSRVQLSQKYSRMRLNSTSMRHIMHKEIVWSRIIADEVHRSAAQGLLAMHWRLRYDAASSLYGLTATFHRNEEKDMDELHNLFFDAKVHTVSWQSLVLLGHIARVNCFKTLVPLDPCFEAALRTSEMKKRELMLLQLNGPTLAAVHRIVQRHKNLKTIVFAQSRVVLDVLAQILRAPCVHGDTTQEMRHVHVEAFNRMGTEGVPMYYYVLVCTEGAPARPSAIPFPD